MAVRASVKGWSRSALAIRGRVSASTQNQALAARIDPIVRARRPGRLPVVLSREEVAAVLGRLQGPTWLMASLLYGSGLRLIECCQLRVKDVDLGRRELTVRDRKGRRDRVTLLPQSLVTTLTAHLAHVRRQHEADLRAGAGYVALPGALRRKYPTHPESGPGSGSSRLPASTSTARLVSAADTTFTSPCYSAP